MWSNERASEPRRPRLEQSCRPARNHDVAHDPYGHTRDLIAKHLAGGDPTAWFDDLYIEAAEGRAVVPWDREEPSALVRTWLEDQAGDGTGCSAVVVGCGFGRGAELTARHQSSAVTYEVGDLLDLPSAWLGAFDLVIESMNVQPLPPGAVRTAGTAGVTSLVAPGGTLFDVAVARDQDEDVAGMPWPLDRPEMEAFGAGLTTRSLERIPDANDLTISRWRAEFVRP